MREQFASQVESKEERKEVAKMRGFARSPGLLQLACLGALPLLASAEWFAIGANATLHHAESSDVSVSLTFSPFQIFGFFCVAAALLMAAAGGIGGGGILVGNLPLLHPIDSQTGTTQS